jgi:AAA15 family ATPase/GTPase
MNVIVGANASGKSNFLQALKFLRDIKDFGIDNAISLQGGIDYLSNLQLKDDKTTFLSVVFSPNGGRVIEKFGNDTVILHYNSITYSIKITTKKYKKYEVSEENIIYDTAILNLAI